MTRVYISDNTSTGRKCKKWAAKNMPKRFKLTKAGIAGCDVFISVGYDKILSADFIKSRRCFNFHLARLPDNAGVGGCTWSILNGSAAHYVTLHEIDGGIDTGPIITIWDVDITKRSTAYSLYEETTQVAFDMFRAWLIDLLLGYYISIPQNLADRKLYTRKDLEDNLDLTTYMRATYFPGRDKPFYINSKGEKIELDYDSRV